MQLDRFGFACILSSLGLTACGAVSSDVAIIPPDAPGAVPDADAVPDAAIDAPAPPPGSPCYGTGLLHMCLASRPTLPYAIQEFTAIDTASSTACAPVTSGGDYCVIAATTITIGATLRASGRRPLVLIASDAITTTALIDVGSHRGATPEVGAGADPAACTVGTLPTTIGGTNGGGAGGSFLRAGGHGGDGTGATGSGGAAGAAVAVNKVLSLRGGCPGQPGDGTAKTPGGHGGGAVFLIAGTSISVAGGINAAGEGGAGAAPMARGGGGGGSGGMIGFDAPMISVTSSLLATGGGGGEASSNTNAGNAGADPTSVAQAPGGSLGNTNGGDGGAGGGSAAAGAGGNGAGQTDVGGGGGGGGGAGLIKAPATANLGTRVAPAAVP